MNAIINEWDGKQLDVIKSGADSRMVVEAGPGTGKTAVACARVASLIDDFGVEPSKIWLVSFTRTAVKEIRDRIESYVSKPRDARSVRITTLDSQVWYLRQGFDEQDIKKLLGGYEANIEAIIQLLRDGDDNLLSYLEELKHVIVDEAQDLVGIRAELIYELVKNLDPVCGVTVFADSAQAIYGFTNEDGEGRRSSGQNVMQELLCGAYGEFSSKELSEVHRTSDSKLLEVFTKVRDVVLSGNFTPEEKLEKIRGQIGNLAHGKLEQAQNQNLDDNSDVLLLYRTRAEVLQASAYLWGAGVPHKLRMSGQPVRLQPWIARIFSDFTDKRIERDKFFNTWSERVGIGPWIEHDLAEQAWEDLVGLCGDKHGFVDVRRMRQMLARSRPPQEFVMPEELLPGPVVGTIHASKGREADYVHLMLPLAKNGRDTDSTPESIDEEGRVVFVGATRARKRLNVGSGHNTYASSLDGGGRVYKLGKRNKSPRAQVEIGRAGDIDLYRLVHMDEWEDPGDAFRNQEFLWRNSLNYLGVYAEQEGKEAGYRFWLHSDDEEHEYIGCLSQSMMGDLWDIGKHVARHFGKNQVKPFGGIRYLKMTGARTVVLDESDDALSDLIAPYSKTGIFLVPVITGFTNVYFRYYNKSVK